MTLAGMALAQDNAPEWLITNIPPVLLEPPPSPTADATTSEDAAAEDAAEAPADDAESAAKENGVDSSESKSSESKARTSGKKRKLGNDYAPVPPPVRVCVCV